MQIKKKILLPIIAILMLSLAQAANAATITGTAYGQQTGFLHFDYTTAVNPCDPVALTCPATPTYNPAAYHFGVKNEFYISPSNLNYGNTGSPAFTAKIQDLPCTDAKCNLTGFLWSDIIGWTILDGSTIRDSGFGGDTDKFPNDYYAKVNYDGIFSGYAWSEKTGWIRLSSDSFDKAAPVTASNYGVWINLTPDPVSPLSNADCSTLDQTKCPASYICNWNITDSKCVSKQIPLGRPLQGYAWSEKLGWIKFSPATGDETFFGAYTTWLPDTSPPNINITENNKWFVNNSDIGTIPWTNIADDPQSGINVDESVITVTKIDASGNFINCQDATVTKSLSADGKSINLALPLIGRIQGTKHGFCAYTISGTVKNGAGLTSPITEKTFYVRAGEYKPEKSTLKLKDDISAVADGTDYIEYDFSPKDIAGNPIVPVKVASDSSAFNDDGSLKPDAPVTNWVRNVQAVYTFDAKDLYFNTISSSPANPSGFLPIKLDDAKVWESKNVYAALPVGGIIRFPATDTIPLNPDPSLQHFILQAASHAPTKGCGKTCGDNNKFVLNRIDLKVTDRQPVIPLIPPPPYVNNYVIDDKTSALPTNALNLAPMEFTPAITTSEGKVSSESLAPADPAFITFKVKNESTISIDTVSIDNLFSLSNVSTDPLSFGSQLFEFRDINTDPAFDDDSISLRTDYINLLSNTLKARYEILSKPLGGDVSDTVFHSPKAENYPPSSYLYDFGTPIKSDINSQGTYEIFAGPGATPESPDITTTIDRSDYVGDSLVFNPKGFVTGGDSKETKINFKIYDIVSETPTSDVKSSVSQYIGYRMPDDNLPVPTFTDYALYELKGVIPDAEVKRVGVQATGIVTGENVFQTIGGREFETVTSPGLANLKKQMRDNAAELTRNIDTTACPASGSLSTLPITGPCVRADTNGTIVAVYGPQGDTLTLDSESDITVPTGKRYTLIVRGGANLFIKDNIAYNSTDSTGSLGIMVLADDKGIGGNVYISPDVTNIVGLLYAEGSLISSPDGGSTLYYVDGGADANNLKNQLYWQGSIVSKNTIGGAASKTAPEGVCGELDPAVCAQVYDLDYLRRFSVTTIKDEHGVPTTTGYVPSPYMFSGGGECTDESSCTAGSLPSCVTLTDGLIDLAPKASKSLDPFFIEKDTRPAPLGFTTGAGFESTIEIR